MGPGSGDLITLGAAVSAFGCALACAVGAARLLFALGRDGVLPRLVEVSHRTGAPRCPPPRPWCWHAIS